MISGDVEVPYLDGNGVDVSGTFTLKSGKIAGSEISKSGGGVAVSEGGTFNMSGGTITGNYTKKNGCGVYVDGTFNMSGGAIETNIMGSYDENGGNGGAYLLMMAEHLQ